MKANWDARKAVRTNLESMGLAFDANQVVRVKTTKEDMVRRAKGVREGEEVEEEEREDSEVVRRLAEEAKEADEAAKKKSKYR